MIRKVLLGSGIAAALLYTVIMAAFGYQGYSRLSQTVSELTAIGTPTARLVLPLEFVYGLLVIGFGVGVRLSSGHSWALRMMAVLLVGNAIIGTAFLPFAQMHQRAVLAAGGGTLSDTLHLIIYGGLSVLSMFLAMALGAAGFGKPFRRYSLGTIAVMLVSGGLTGQAGPRVSANLPTPWVGLEERISILAYMLWMAVLAVALLRTAKKIENPAAPRASVVEPAASKRDVPRRQLAQL